MQLAGVMTKGRKPRLKLGKDFCRSKGVQDRGRLSETRYEKRAAQKMGSVTSLQRTGRVKWAERIKPQGSKGEVSRVCHQGESRI